MRATLCLLLTIAACHPVPSPAPPPEPAVTDADDDGLDGARHKTDAGTTDIYLLGCWQLHELGCKEGNNADACAASFRKADGVLVDLKMSCIASAKDVAHVRACAPAWKRACEP